MAASPLDSDSPLRARLRAYPVVAAVAAIVFLGLLARLILLGSRPAHWDEARVAYWALYAADQGSYTYRYIVHGPVAQHTARWLFGLLGASDTVARLPVAIVGAALPASALLFRKHLRDSELLALALFLAFNPFVLYYSRFMRSDVLVGAFMFVALGLCVRFYDTRKRRYLYGIGLFATLAVASKENAILYPVTWLGALGLLADRALDRPGDDETGVHRLLRVWTRLRETDIAPLARRYLPHLLGSLVVSFVVFVFMFAPRGAGFAGLTYPPAPPTDASVNLGSAFSNPARVPDLVGATVDRFLDQYGAWASGSRELTFDEYLTRLGASLRGIATAALPLSVFALVGFARERYGRPEGRPFVMAMFFAGVASLVGYPLGLSITGGWRWNNVAVMLPLAIPAAVGVAMVGRWVVEAFRGEDRIGRGLMAFVIVVAVGLTAGNAVSLVYLNDQHSSNRLVQHGQPADDLDSLVADLDAAAATDAPDVLFYGNTSMQGSFVRSGNVTATNGAYMNIRPVCADWTESFPIQWYMASTGADGECAQSVQALRYQVENETPDIVVVRETDDSVPTEWLSERYEATTYSLRSNDRKEPRATVYVRPSLADES